MAPKRALKNRKRNRDIDEDNNEFDMTAVDEKVEAFDVNFAFLEPREQDFHGVKPVLTRGWDFCRKDPIVCLTELTDTVCNQGNIGTIVKTGDDKDVAMGEFEEKKGEHDPRLDEVSGVFSVCTILNTRQYKKEMSESLPKLLQWVRKHAKEEAKPYWEELIAGTNSPAISSSQ